MDVNTALIEERAVAIEEVAIFSLLVVLFLFVFFSLDSVLFNTIFVLITQLLF